MPLLKAKAGGRGESSATEVPPGFAMCHDYPMGGRADAMPIPQKIQGEKGRGVASIGARN